MSLDVRVQKSVFNAIGSRIILICSASYMLLLENNRWLGDANTPNIANFPNNSTFPSVLILLY